MRTPTGFSWESPYSRYVHVGRSASILRFRIRPQDPDWSSLNPVEGWPSVAFPLRPVRIHHEGLVPFVADSNTAILFDTTRPYRRSLIDEAGAEAITFKYPGAIVREAVGHFDPSVLDADSVFAAGHGPVPSPVYLRQRGLFAHLLRHPEADPLFVEELALAILGEVVHAAFGARGVCEKEPRSRTAGAHRRLSEEIKELLATCYSERLTLDDVSNALGGTSPFHLCRVFRRCTGRPVHRYLTDLRLRAALERLQDGEPVGRVSAQVGFKTHSHFSAVFQRELGETPSELGRKLAEGEPPPQGERASRTAPAPAG